MIFQVYQISISDVYLSFQLSSFLYFVYSEKRYLMMKISLKNPKN